MKTIVVNGNFDSRWHPQIACGHRTIEATVGKKWVKLQEVPKYYRTKRIRKSSFIGAVRELRLLEQDNGDLYLIDPEKI
jgi:hypothetical protein|tara:strand:- start:5629 stop:5865 length:237 start_codon:yes stop_codon:yes gene_type:complete